MSESSFSSAEFKLPTPTEVDIAQFPSCVIEIFEADDYRGDTTRLISDTGWVYEFDTDRTYVFPFEFDFQDNQFDEGTAVMTVDVDNQGREGHGYICSRIHGYLMPYVGFTRTEERKLREGLGKRRLRIMNDLSLKLFEIPLSSNATMEDEAVSLWASLVRSEEAEIVDWDGHYGRFRFLIENATTSTD